MIRPGARLVLALLFVLLGCDAGSRPAPVARSVSPSASAVPDASASSSDIESPPTSSPTPQAVPSPMPTVGAPDAERAVRLATLLAEDVGPRPAGSDGDAVARLLVAAWLRGAGWRVTEQEVGLPQGGRSANVVATWDGRGTDGPHVVVGAHLDTVDGSPGGNDNASGVGALVALAAELADEAKDLPVPVVLVAFAAEEYQPSQPRQHHIGSELYAEQRGDEVVAMVSVDMVGHGPLTCICWYEAGPPTLALRLAELAGDEGYRVEARGDNSDHGPFARRGVPSALLWTYLEPRFHSPQDTADHLEVEAVRRATDLTVAFVRSLGPGDREGLAAPS